MDELRFRSVEIWQKQMEADWQTMIVHCTTYTVQYHDVDDTTTRKSHQDKAWPPNTPGTREAEHDIPPQTRTPKNNTQGFEEPDFSMKGLSTLGWLKEVNITTNPQHRTKLK